MYSKRVAQGMNGSIGVEGELEAAVFEAFDFGFGLHVEVFWGSCAAWVIEPP